MRVQIYQEELGEGVEIIEQTSRNGEVFFGLRIWLKTCQPLLDHSTPEDDDRSAVTFWASSLDGIKDLFHEISHAIAKRS